MQGKQVLLTGGTGGLGLGVTPEVIKRGGKLTITYRHEKDVQRQHFLNNKKEAQLITTLKLI